MTDTANLGLPFIEASQAQKHVTHNDALRILDAAIQIAVLDTNRTGPPASPAEGERHVVAPSPAGAWAGQARAIATWQDGAWAFLAPKRGWCIWSVADAVMFVFDGTVWRDLRNLAVDNLAHLGVNTSATAPNLLSVKSNAALFAAINAATGGSGDMRLQMSKESAAKTASVVFSDNYSGRAEFGLIGSDAFRLKVSADGSSFVDSFSIDQGSGNLTLPKGVSLTGVVAPPQITANQNDYNPGGIVAASVLQMSSDAARTISGLAGGADGRVVSVINVGSQPIALLDESSASAAANRFMLGGDLTIPVKQAAMLRYDGSASRWQTMARPIPPGTLMSSSNLADIAGKTAAFDNLSVHGADIASAATVNLEGGTGNLIDITGATAITAITLADGHERTVRFTGALTLTNGGSLVLPGGASITTEAGDFAVFRGYAGGVVRCIDYVRSARAPFTGKLIRTDIFTASGTWTRPAGCKYIEVRVQAPGGAGGSCAATGASDYAPAAGGSAGGYAFSRVSNPGATESVTIGAAGASGAAGNNNGGSGGNASFGSWCSGVGGVGGAGGANLSVLYATSAISGGGGTGDVIVPGGPSGPGLALSSFAVIGGQGGQARMGCGGVSPNNAAGTAPVGGYGGGGSGAANSNSSAAKQGGAGAPGIVIVKSYE